MAGCDNQNNIVCQHRKKNTESGNHHFNWSSFVDGAKYNAAGFLNEYKFINTHDILFK